MTLDDSFNIVYIIGFILEYDNEYIWKKEIIYDIMICQMTIL